MKEIYKSPSVIALMIANIIPIIGVLFWDYNLGSILLLYWAESGIIGLYVLMKMIIVTLQEGWSGLILLPILPFFVFHFGAFMIGHLVFILMIINSSFISGSVEQPLSQVFFENTGNIHSVLLALVISHGFSFAYNFIGKQEYKKLRDGELMTSPYGRIIVMHITIILGAFASIILGHNIGFLILFVLLKIFMDASAHIKEHKKLDSI